MSADNWASCPKCYRDAVEARNKEVEAVGAAYGKVSLEDFHTLREDYEITGADEGVLDFSYSGSCHVCGLQLNIMHERHPFPGFEEKL